MANEPDARRLLEVMPDAVFVSVGDVVTYANAALVRVLGAASTSAVVGRPVRSMFVTGNGERENRPPPWLDAPDPAALAEARIARDDGTEVPVEVTSSPTDVHGEAGVLVILHDLTRRYDAQAAVAAKEAFLQSVVAVALDGIITIDHHGTITTFNRAAERIFGYQSSEVTGCNVNVLMPEPYRSEHDGYIGSYLTSGTPRVIGIGREVHGRRKDGSTFPLDLAVAEFQWHGRRHFTGTLRDLTERHRLEDRLTEEGQFNAMMMEALPGLVFLIDGRYRLRRWNKQVERASGFTGDEVARMSPLDFFVEADRPRVAASMRDVLARGQASLEAGYQSRDGEVRPYFFSGVRHDGADGPGILGIGVDVSERHGLEAQLRQAQKMEAFGQLAGGVAHDFNNLLTVISGYSEVLMSMMAEGDPRVEAVEPIVDAAARAALLTRQMLAFSRRAVLDPQVVDVNAVVADTERMLRRLIGEDVSLSAVLEPAVHPVRLDPGHLGQVLMNLAVNARDAMPTGGRLTIQTTNVQLDDGYGATHAEVRPGPYVMLAVSDTGTGMPPEVKARIFEPFFTTKGVFKGTGLGLAVVHGIVKQSGGHIEVYSEAGLGTTFKLYFPAVSSEAAGTVVEAPSTSPFGTETVLLVEDEDGVRALAELALRRFGYTVLSAGLASDALRLMAERGSTVSLLITDVVMPEMGGAVLARRLRATDPELKVLFLSGYTEDAIVRHGILQETVAFLQKPFSVLALARKVREVLDA